jgi:hypothetical protein
VTKGYLIGKHLSRKSNCLQCYVRLFNIIGYGSFRRRIANFIGSEPKR